MVFHVRWSDTFMGFLCAFCLGRIMGWFGVVLSIFTDDLGFCCLYRKIREIHRIGSHISNMPCFIELLSDLHRPCNGKSEFSTRFLLKGRGCKRSWRWFLSRFYLNITHFIARSWKRFQKFCSFCFIFELFTEFGSQIFLFIGQKLSYDLEKGISLKSLNFPFSLYNQFHSHRLHPSSRKSGFDFPPKHWRKLKSHQSIQHPSRLLSIHQMHINRSRVSDCVFYRRFSNLVKNNPRRRFYI